MGFKGITMNTLPSKPGHILAEDDAAIYQGIIGSDGVFSIGDKFKTTVLSNNKVRVSNGVLSVQGHIGRTEYGDYTDMTIENGVSGQKRNDLIVARYTVGTTEDSFILAVKKGVSGAAASDPAVTRGDLYQGAKLRELPLWRIKIEGLSIVKVEPMFAVKPTGEEMERQISELNSNCIIESGKNNNGYYRKYADGTLEMWGNTKIKFTFAGDKWGNVFYVSRQKIVTFPVPSLTEAIININAWNNSVCFVNLSTLANNKTEFAVYMVEGSGADYDSLVYWHAFGTWK